MAFSPTTLRAVRVASGAAAKSEFAQSGAPADDLGRLIDRFARRHERLGTVIVQSPGEGETVRRILQGCTVGRDALDTHARSRCMHRDAG